MEVLNLGCGVQSTALAILNVTGRVNPRAELAVFADTGAEMPETYAYLDRLAPWLTARGLEVVRVKHEPDLETAVLTGPRLQVPVYVPPDGGYTKRDCTQRWKIAMMRQEWRRRGARQVTSQIGISLDEWHRAKDSDVKWVTFRYPLLEMELSRDDCRAVIREAGLPYPSKSACWFCPFSGTHRWQMLATEHPDLFERACQIEEALQERRRQRGETPGFLNYAMRPLRQRFSPDQLALPLEEQVCDGHCFT